MEIDGPAIAPLFNPCRRKAVREEYCNLDDEDEARYFSRCTIASFSSSTGIILLLQSRTTVFECFATVIPMKAESKTIVLIINELSGILIVKV